MTTLTNLFNTTFTDASETLSVPMVLIALAAALVMGGIIAFTYWKTQEDELCQRSFAITLWMLPIILAVIILFVGSNVARAFSLAGTLSIIRFRSAPGDPKDIGFIFFSIAAGLAAGVGLYGYGLLFVILLCAALLLLEGLGLFQKKALRKSLRITVPEDLNYEGAFDDILETYTKSYRLTKIKTTDLGSLFELSYSIVMPPKGNDREFLNELRARNGNLNIILSVEPTA